MKPFIAGKIPLKRGTIKALKLSKYPRDLHMVDNLSGIQKSYGDYYLAQLIRKNKGLFGADSKGYRTENAILRFKSVEKHQDDWDSVTYKGKQSKPVFVHVVLQGEFTFKSNGVTLECKKGDILVHEANLLHSAKTKNDMTCVTFTVDTHVKLIEEHYAKSASK